MSHRQGTAARPGRPGRTAGVELRVEPNAVRAWCDAYDRAIAQLRDTVAELRDLREQIVRAAVGDPVPGVTARAVPADADADADSEGEGEGNRT